MGIFDVLCLIVVLALLVAGLLEQLAWAAALTYIAIVAGVAFVAWLLRMYLPPRKP